MMTDGRGVMTGISREVTQLLHGCMLMLMVMLLVACAGQAPVPEDLYYRLPEAVPVQTVEQKLAGRVAVARLDSDGLRDERAILYVSEERPLEISRYHYHHWVDAPTRMIQQHMLSFFRSAEMASSVVRADPGVDAEYVVAGRLLRFERIVGTDNGKVLVEMELAIHHDHTPYLAQKTYRTEVRPRGKSLHEVAEAFGTALQEIYQQFVKEFPPIIQSETR